MINATKIVWEQLKYFPLIIRMSKYGDQSTYQNFFLGNLWKIFNPILQVSVYFVVFGLGLRNSSSQANTWDYIAWLMSGMALWRFMSSSILGGSQSIKKQASLVTKMKFPVSILPSVNIASNIWTFAVLAIISFGCKIASGHSFTDRWFLIFYYLLASVCLIYSFALFNSTISILIPDYMSILRLIMSLAMWVSGVIIKMDKITNSIGDILRLNPFYYLVTGVRDSWIAPNRVFRSEFWNTTIIFWAIIVMLLILGSYLNLKFRKNFMEYL